MSIIIPESVKKVIKNIKEITGNNHEDYEIYATLKDCSMDPNETTQKLLNQDTFHEVKRKRDRKKENTSNRESVEPRWKPGQGRGTRGGGRRVNYLSCSTPNDTVSRNSSVGKENNSNQIPEKSVVLSSPTASQVPKKNEVTATISSASAMMNGPSVIVTKGVKADISKLGGLAPHARLNIVQENPRESSGTRKTYAQLTSSSNNRSSVETQGTSPSGYFSSSDPVLVPSHDSRIPGAAGAIKREVGCHQTPTEQISLFPSEGKTVTATSEVGNSSMEGNNVQINSIGAGKNQQSLTTPRPSSAHGGSSIVRPSSNHSSRSQQVVGPPKVGPAKEWKPKSTNQNVLQGSSMAVQSEVSAAMKVSTQSHPVTCDLDPKEGSNKVQTKLEELRISDSQPLILPNLSHVPGSGKISFCFGSFDAISLDRGCKIVPDDSNPALPSETLWSSGETAETSSLHIALATTEEGGYHDHLQSPEHVPENVPLGEHDVPSAGSEEYGESKHERDLSQGSHQYPIVHASLGYGLGFMPTMMGSQPPPFDNLESQARDASRIPSFVVPQPYDPASYYAQFYRSAPDSDGHVSPFHAAGVATKYNGSVSVLPPQTSQSAQEDGNSLVVSTSGPTTFVTQPAPGVMSSSMDVTQQPVPVFRPPYGIPFPHYPHNFMPYGPYFSPYFIQHFNQSMNNAVFPQQSQAGGVYPAPSGPSPKFSLSQYKPGTSSGNSNSVGNASSYGSYGPSSSTAGHSTTNEELNSQQFKENDVYITGQQSEGSAVWLTPPGQDLSGAQASSFYNIPSQGHLAFPQPQPGHGPFTGIYHTAQGVSTTTGHPLLQPSQTMASSVDIAGPAPNVYQQPQHAHVTWPNNNY